jgi:hypothetical protein
MKRMLVLLATVGALSAGCAAPNPGSLAGAPRQDCASCQLDNPGDVSVCLKACPGRHEADGMGQDAGGVLH